MQATTQLWHWFQLALFNRSWQEYLAPFLEHTDPMANVGCCKAELVGRRHDTHHSTTLTLRPNRQWQGFVPGQYVLLSCEIQGRRTTRAYSICSEPERFAQQGLIEITAKREPEGRMSSWLSQWPSSGSVLEISQAQGEFVLPARADAPPTGYLMLAAGSGATPFRSLVSSALAQQLPVHWLYSSPSEDECLFAEHWRQLASRHEHFTPSLHFSRGEDGGRLDRQRLQQYCPDAGERLWMICGPQGFIQSMREIAQQLGVPDHHIRVEQFGPPKPTSSEAGEAVTVELTRSQRQLQLVSGQNLLVQLEANGVYPKTGCRSGICHTCLCGKQQGQTRNQLTGELSNPGNGNIQLCIHQIESDLSLDL